MRRSTGTCAAAPQRSGRAAQQGSAYSQSTAESAAAAKLDRVTQELTAANDRKGELSAALEELARKERTADERLASLDEQLRAAQQRANTLTTDLRYEQEQSERLRVENSRWSSQMRVLGESMALKEAAAKRSDERIVQLTQKQDALEEEVKGLKASKDELNVTNGRLQAEAMEAKEALKSTQSELWSCNAAKETSEAKVITLEHSAKRTSERQQQLDAELAQAVTARDRLVGQLREAEEKERGVRGQLSKATAERERARERIAALPQALQTLQTRITDSLLRPLQETLRVELAAHPLNSVSESEQSNGGNANV